MSSDLGLGSDFKEAGFAEVQQELTVKIPRADVFAILMQFLADIVPESTFSFKEGGIRVCHMDPGHYTLIDMEIYSNADREALMTVDVEDVMKFLKHVKKDDVITLSFNESEKRLRVTITNIKGGSERAFEVRTLEPSEPLNPPVLSYEASVKMDLKPFYDAISDVSKVSDEVKITIKPDSVTISAYNEYSNVRQTHTFKNPTVSEIEINRFETNAKNEAKDEVTASYSAIFLLRFLKYAKKLSDRVELRLSTNKPIKFTIRHFLGKIDYLVAPRLR